MPQTRAPRVVLCPESSNIPNEEAIPEPSCYQETMKKLGSETPKLIQDDKQNPTHNTLIMRSEKLNKEKHSGCSVIRKITHHRRPQVSSPQTKRLTLPSIAHVTTLVCLQAVIGLHLAAAVRLPPSDAALSPGIQKRQIYRESLAPSLGGVIPAGALSKERLKYNAQDAVGIEAPDGLVYQPRETDVRPGARDPEDINEILTLTKQLHPGEPTDYNGMMPPKAQKTTYLLRRPHKYSRNISPSIIHPDASQTSPDNYQVADIPRPPHYKEFLPNPHKFPHRFPFQTGYASPPPADFNTIGSVLGFYSNHHFDGIYSPKFVSSLHVGGHLQNVRSYLQHPIIVI